MRRCDIVNLFFSSKCHPATLGFGLSAAVAADCCIAHFDLGGFPLVAAIVSSVKGHTADQSSFDYLGAFVDTFRAVNGSLFARPSVEVRTKRVARVCDDSMHRTSVATGFILTACRPAIF